MASQIVQPAQSRGRYVLHHQQEPLLSLILFPEHEMVGQAVLLFQHALGQKGLVLQADLEEVLRFLYQARMFEFENLLN